MNSSMSRFWTIDPLLEYLLDKILEVHLSNLSRFVSLGSNVQVVQIMADDLGGQNSLPYFSQDVS